MKPRILIIDDEPGFATLLKRLLEDLELYEVRIATTGREGLAAARDFRPHLILLDMLLPDMNGGEVSQMLAADSALRDARIVFLTALSARQQTLRYVGGRPLLAKSGKIDPLLAFIRDQLEGHIAQNARARRTVKADPEPRPS